MTQPHQTHGAAEPAKSAWLFEPRAPLRGLIYVAVARDTRGLNLSPEERWSCMPAYPLCGLKWVFEGAVHPLDEAGALTVEPTPAFSFVGPYRRPLTSWSPGPVCALSIVFYPDAWRELFGFDASGVVDRIVSAEVAMDRGTFARLGALCSKKAEPAEIFERAQDLLEPLWTDRRAANAGLAPMLRDWTRDIAARAARSGVGRSARQAQRRVKSWTGRTLSELENYARMESLFELVRLGANAPNLAEIAAKAGYSDQSHMGREVKRLTGLSPARINALIRSDERYWLYRLMGERF